MTHPNYSQIALALGALSAALILGALGFQYIGSYPPCEMCMWQRYPHFGAIVTGLIGGWLVMQGILPKQLGRAVAIVTLLLVAMTGAIGVYHSGVEWHLWKGPSACTGPAFHMNGDLDLNAHVVSCDYAAWRLFGISMAGYNAIISLGAAAVAVFVLSKTEK